MLDINEVVSEIIEENNNYRSADMEATENEMEGVFAQMAPATPAEEEAAYKQWQLDAEAEWNAADDSNQPF